MKILMVLTSHNQLGKNLPQRLVSGFKDSRPPYFAFRDAGVGDELKRLGAIFEQVQIGNLS